MEKLQVLHQRMHKMSEVVGSLLVDAFHYLALFAIGGAIVWSAVHAFMRMGAAGRGLLADPGRFRGRRGRRWWLRRFRGLGCARLGRPLRRRLRVPRPGRSGRRARLGRRRPGWARMQSLLVHPGREGRDGRIAFANENPSSTNDTARTA